MLTPAVLEIIRLALEAYLETLRGIPLNVRQEQAAMAWENHKKLIAFLEGLTKREA